MENIPEAPIFHVIVKKKVARRGQRVSLEADKIPVLDASDGLKLCLELLQALRILRVESLDGDRLAIFKNAFVYCA